MSSLEIFMPLVVLGLSFMLKLLIDRSASVPDVISSTLELPVDITFLATSLIVGFTISPSGDSKAGLAWFSFYIFGAIVIVWLWRRSISCFLKANHKTAFCLGAVNYLLSITAVVNSVKLITGVLNAKP